MLCPLRTNLSECALAFALALVGCSHGAAPNRWNQVKSFACQLQNLDPAKVPPTDLLITDPTRDGSTRLTPAEMAQLKTGKRLLLGYLSIGEAENYRPYWQKGWKPGNPAWLGPTNRKWGGNYKVRYWDPAWRELALKNAEEIQKQGFDGLFLDVVDGWEFWQARFPQAKTQMSMLVQAIAAQTRRQQADFGIFLNGGDGLLEEPGLLGSITGVAKEEIFYGLGGDGRLTPPEFTAACQKRLKVAVESRILVLSIDYTNDPKQKRRARERAQQGGYLEFIGSRGLDRIPPQD